MGKPASANTGSLLRLFQSEFFDVHLHMHYLLSMESGGVQDYLVNALYKMGDDDVDFYLPQLCQLALLRYQKSSLHHFLKDKASKSMHFALKINWLMTSYAEDKRPEIREAALAMVQNCEEAMLLSGIEAPGGSEAGGAQASQGHHAGLHHARASLPQLANAAGDGTPPAAGAVTTGGGVSPAAGAVPSQPGLAGHVRWQAMRRIRSCPELASRPGAETEDAAVAPVRLSSTPKARPRHFSMGLEGDRSDEGDGTGRTGIDGSPESSSQLVVPATSSTSSLRDRCAASGASTPGHCRSKVLRRFVSICQTLKPEQWSQAAKLQACLPNAYAELGNPLVDWMLATAEEGHVDGHMYERGQFMLKEVRRGFFSTQKRLVEMITKITVLLVQTADKDERKARLKCTVRLLNRWLLDRRVVGALAGDGQLSLMGLHIPALRGRDYKQQVLHVHADQCKVFSSATRAPFLLVYETANLEEPRGDSDPTAVLADCVIQELRAANCQLSCPEEAGGFLGLAEQPLLGHLAMLTSEEWLSTPAMDLVMATNVEEGQGSPGGEEKSPSRRQREQSPKVRLQIWGESWECRRAIIKRSSPFGTYPSWELNAVVVKGGDDLRQELLASQVIKQFSSIFKEARLPLWLKEMEVLVTSSSSGCIEFLHNSMSVTGIKKMFPETSLADIFKDAFADQLFQAKRNFIESYAAYSLIVWFLQVKDRHNDNVMMLSSGHITHLDFGFMLSNSPGGNMGFEQSPFKLTQEFLDVMGGEFSDEYEYFRTLVVRGFLEARKHVDRIVLPVRMLLASGSKLPCFRDGLEWVLQTLQDRFYINLTEEACIEKVLELIDTSVNNWSTIQYDMYQKYMNGIV